LAHRADIYLAPLDTAAHAVRERELLPRLAPAEQARYRGFSAEMRRQSWLAGRELLLSALVHARGEADPSELLTEDHGGVRHGRAELRLNLSHSGGWLAAAVASVPVGIDIERLRPRAVASQAARVFCPEEAARLAREADPLPLFYRLWTLKEAACKAAGLTIWDALHHACFDLETGHCRLAPPFPPGPWHFIYGDFAPDWRLALALHGGSPEVDCWRREAAVWAPMTLTGSGRVAGD
jgi:4'-phosphopantetheinyl transferase